MVSSPCPPHPYTPLHKHRAHVQRNAQAQQRVNFASPSPSNARKGTKQKCVDSVSPPSPNAVCNASQPRSQKELARLPSLPVAVTNSKDPGSTVLEFLVWHPSASRIRSAPFPPVAVTSLRGPNVYLGVPGLASASLCISNHGCSSVSEFLHALPSLFLRVEPQAVLVPDQALDVVGGSASLLASSRSRALVSTAFTERGGLMAFFFLRM